MDHMGSHVDTHHVCASDILKPGHAAAALDPMGKDRCPHSRMAKQQIMLKGYARETNATRQMLPTMRNARNPLCSLLAMQWMDKILHHPETLE